MKRYCTAFSVVWLLCIFAVGSFWSESSKAAPLGEEKSLRGRLGVGFTNQIATAPDATIPAMSAKYYLSRSFATSMGIGFNTKNNDSTVAIGAKFYKNLFYETNLIFYTGLGLAMVSRQGSKAQGSLFLGSEFFFSQLPSLGFTFEAGIRGDNYTGAFAIRTTGDSFLTGGIHFYF